MQKTLMLAVYSNPSYRRCASGGISETANDIFVICPNGPFNIADDDPRLFRLATTLNSLHLEPVNPAQGEKTIGPMMGGSYAATSDARFSRLCESLTGHPFYGAVAIHDRYETPEQYELLSR